MREKKYRDWTDTDNEQAKEIPYLNLFLDRYSESSEQRIYNALMDFAVYCKTNFKKSILEANGLEILQYFKSEINKRTKKTKSGNIITISKTTKQNYRVYLSAYYNYVRDVKKDLEKIVFDNPVPSARTFDFKGKTTDLEDLESKVQLLSMESIQQVLFYFFYQKYSHYETKPSRSFIIVCLIVFTGARIREIVQVQLKNLDVKNRWFITEVKSPKASKRAGIYFFPEFFRLELEHYLELLKKERPEALYLFELKKGKPMSVRTVQGQLEKARGKLGLEALTNPHRFRDFLNTKRLDAGCDQSLRKFLLNQKAGDVNPDNYLKKYKNRIYLRGIYDKYNPFNKNIMPEKPKF